MDAGLVSRRGSTAGWVDWLVGAVTAGIVVLGMSLVVFTVVNGPQPWQALELQNAAAIEQEDAQFCSKFAMPPGTEAFVACTTELAGIRRSQTDRMDKMRNVNLL